MRYMVTLIREHPETNLPKALRHLKTNLHWSKQLFRTEIVDESTVIADGHYPNIVESIQHFSGYYPHVFFTLTGEDFSEPITFLNMVQVPTPASE